jgi:hypothetical protein
VPTGASDPADPDGKMINGWPQQADLLAAMHTLRPLGARKPKVMWRGRASPEPRDEVRCACGSTPMQCGGTDVSGVCGLLCGLAHSALAAVGDL